MKYDPDKITYGSVCSGIEAVSVAWEPLGFKPVWFSEIKRFPSAVLKYHWPHVPNLGDMTKIAEKIRVSEAREADRRSERENIAGNILTQEEQIEAPDILVGGTPCQAFSLTGLRKSLSDERGQLTLSFVRLADVIDDVRVRDGKKPCVVIWENVPGVFNTDDNAFGNFLAALSGEDVPLEPPGKKWSDAGYVSGPKRAVAWRVLDAQYFGLAQRRKRVFLIASARTDINPAEILFEFDGVRRDSPPGEEKQPEVAGGSGGSVAKRSEELAFVFTRRGLCGTVSPTLLAATARGMCCYVDGQVRRLMPVECERLQGFPDDFTKIPWRNGRVAGRYEALGNSIAVPVMRWLGERLRRYMNER